MRQRRLVLAVIALGLIGPASEAVEPALHTGSLRQMITLEEQFRKANRRDGIAVLPLAFGVPAHHVHVNSTVTIHVDTAGWVRALEADSDLADLLSPEARALLEQSTTLRGAADELVAAVRDATELTRLVADGEGVSEQAIAVAQRLQGRFRSSFRIAREYLTTLAASPVLGDVEHGAELREQLNFAIDSNRGGGGRLAVAAVLLAESERVANRVAEMASQAGHGADSLALILSAIHVSGETQTEVALPGYNNIPEGLPVDFQQISLVPTPEQLAEMRELRDEAARWAGILNRVRDEGEALENAVRDLLSGTTIDLAPLLEAVEGTVTAFEELEAVDWTEVGRDLETRLQLALDDAADEAERALLDGGSELARAITTYRDRSRLFSADTVELNASVVEWRVLLIEGSSAEEIDVLVGLLGLVNRTHELIGRGGVLLDDLGREAKTWLEDGRRLHQAADEVEAAAISAGEGLRDDVRVILEDAAHEQLGGLVNELEKLATEAEGLATRVGELFDSVDESLLQTLEATRVEPPESSFDVPLNVAGDTRIDLRTLNPRKERDVVVLRAWLYRVEPQGEDTRLIRRGERVDAATQQLQMLRFGWYNAPSVGLTYLSSFDTPAGRDDVSRAFVPQVSWMFLRRSWRQETDPITPAEYIPKWHDHLSIGMHAVTVDMDADNQLEVGMGLTIGVWNDWVQLGVGVNLGLDNEPYYFVGTRLFELFKSAGIDAAPGVTTPP